MYSVGFVFLHRKILEWEWFRNENTFRVFLYLILISNYRNERFEGLEIERGQCVTSVRSICEKLSMTPAKVRTALKHLEKTGEISVKTFSKFSLVTIKNYNKYQNPQQKPDGSEYSGEYERRKKPEEEESIYSKYEFDDLSGI